MHVVMIGSGYVGLVSGACFADFGHRVTCIDRDAEKIAALNAGSIPIYEPGLDELVAKNRREGRLVFTTEFDAPVREADAVFIAVGTPSRRGDGHADLGYVREVARDLARAVSGFTVVVTKSTVPVGTGDEVARIMAEARPGIDVAVVSNPEFLREGAAIWDFKHPDRIVVGVEDPRARDVMAEVYRPLYLNAAPIHFTDRRSAELVKYAANAFLAMKITFINEMADLCETVGADVQAVARGMGADARIGPKFLHPGPGFGGSCLPKDTLALVKTAVDNDIRLHLVETTVAVNERRKRAMGRRIVRAVGGDVRGRTVAVLGLTFKQNTDDMRDSPSLSIIQALLDAGAVVRAYDPVGMDQARRLLADVAFCADPYEAAEGASALAIVTEWDQFRALDFTRLGRLVAEPLLVDLRNIYRPDEVTRHGFSYVGVGRCFPVVAPPAAIGAGRTDAPAGAPAEAVA